MNARPSTAAAHQDQGARKGHGRRDVQGMRALAVGVVVVYHLWPSLLPGGFVGVDVFFVISGYLIIGSLVRELSRTGRVRLADFYARRIRRLLPASTLVIVVSVVGTLLLLPESQWRKVLSSALTSALQVQNWVLAYGPDEYAQATAEVSPFQHFWSLAVEEQFYLVVPLLMVVAALVARRTGRASRRVVTAMLAVTFVASLVWSVFLSATEPAVAYFVTTTRAWELALGGLVALLGARVRSRRAGAALGVVGLVAVLVPAATYSTSMAFPGWIALVPTLGTALLLVSGATSGPSTGVARALSARPLVYVGDISYSLYLWHWPIIVFALVVVGGAQLTAPLALAVLALSVLAAVASTRWVEAPFRRSPTTTPAAARHARPRAVLAPTYALGAGLVGLSLAVAVVPLAEVVARSDAATQVVAGAENPGAAVFDGVVAPAGATIVPDPLVAAGDLPVVNLDRCIEADITAPESSAVPVDASTCRYGADGGAPVVLVGDSHAAVLSTPLARIAEQHGLRLTALVRNGCPFTLDPMSSEGIPFAECGERNRRNLQLILDERPELVVVSGMTADGYRTALGWGWADETTAVAAYRDTLRPLVEAGIRVVVVRDTPYPPFVGPECVAEHGPGALACAFPRPVDGKVVDPAVEAARNLDGVDVVDLTDGLCEPEECRAVEGNVLVYRDNHLTDTYALSLLPRLTRELGLG
nr:acyltransferase family protein [Cellulosimicrobium sp. SH8]